MFAIRQMMDHHDFHRAAMHTGQWLIISDILVFVMSDVSVAH